MTGKRSEWADILRAQADALISTLAAVQRELSQVPPTAELQPLAQDSTDNQRPAHFAGGCVVVDMLNGRQMCVAEAGPTAAFALYHDIITSDADLDAESWHEAMGYAHPTIDGASIFRVQRHANSAMECGFVVLPVDRMADMIAAHLEAVWDPDDADDESPDADWL